MVGRIFHVRNGPTKMNQMYGGELQLSRNMQLFNSKENAEIYSNCQQLRNKPQTMISIADFLKILSLILFGGLKLFYDTFKALFKKPKTISGKICLVTGTGRGLGRGLAVKLANLGATVICVDIREDANNETVKLIKDSGGIAYGYICNVAKHEEVIKLAETVQKEVGHVYLLLNNAGLIMVHKAGEWSPEEVTSMFSVNTMSHYWMIQAFLPAMKEHNEGHIANVISITSFFPMPIISLYGATKAASDYLLRALRIELNFKKDNNIIVSGIYPCVINTSDDIDYLIAKGNLGVLQIEEAVEEIVEGIRCDKTTIVVPNYVQPFMNFASILPEFLIIKIFGILNICVNIPSGKYKEKMPFYEILHKCK